MTQLQRPDSLRAVLDSVFAAPRYRWNEHRDAFALLKRWWHELQAWLTALQDRSPLAYELIQFALVAILVAIVVHTAWVFLQTVRTHPRPDAGAPSAVSGRDRDWYRREADRLASEERFADAIQADFLSLVLALDERALVRFHPSKTPGEYVRDGEFDAVTRNEFRELVDRMYGYAFARRPCGPREYADWRACAVAERYAAAH